jgi:anaerobic selenocysteine-containing dehydrogenase
MAMKKPARESKLEAAYNSPMRVAHFHATRASDPDRGPQVRMREDDAVRRLLTDGELVWVNGPRRKELAVLVIDDRLGRGDVALRDIAGIAPSEVVTVVKPEFDRGPRPNLA